MPGSTLPGLPEGWAPGVATTTWVAVGPGAGLPRASAVRRAGRSSRSQWLTVASGPTSASLKLRAPPNGIPSAVFFIAGALKKAPRASATTMAMRALAAVLRRRPNGSLSVSRSFIRT